MTWDFMQNFTKKLFLFINLLHLLPQFYAVFTYTSLYRKSSVVYRLISA